LKISIFSPLLKYAALACFFEMLVIKPEKESQSKKPFLNDIEPWNFY